MRPYHAAFAAGLLWSLPAAAQEHPEVRTYGIRHALFGDIGTLSDEIMRNGNVIQVVTRADVEVVILGIRLHRVHAEWNETWQDGILKNYQASTTRNNVTASISGWHQDGVFVLHANGLEARVSADVHPVHPWSLQFVRSAILMSPESGRIFPADVENQGDGWIQVGSEKTRVHHYVVRTNTTNHLYFDDEGTLVLAQYRDIAGTVTIMLRSDDRSQVGRHDP